jgi:hypothetical protein
LQQVIDADRRHRQTIDGQSLHDLLGERFQSVERLPDQGLNHLARELLAGLGQEFLHRGILVDGQDRDQDFQRPRVAAGAFPRAASFKRRGRHASLFNLSAALENAGRLAQAAEVMLQVSRGPGSSTWS